MAGRDGLGKTLPSPCVSTAFVAKTLPFLTVVRSDGHDLQARMFLDTTRPQHGRNALRVTVPSTKPLQIPWSTSLAQSDVYHTDGYQLDGSTDYSVRLWARSDSPDGMKLEVLTGHLAVNPKVSGPERHCLS